MAWYCNVCKGGYPKQNYPYYVKLYPADNENKLHTSKAHYYEKD